MLQTFNKNKTETLDNLLCGCTHAWYSIYCWKSNKLIINTHKRILWNVNNLNISLFSTF